MLTDMMKDPLQVARLIAVIDQLDVIAVKIEKAGDVDDDDVQNLTELVGHIKDFRPGSA